MGPIPAWEEIMQRNNEIGSQKLGLFSKITKCLFLKIQNKKEKCEERRTQGNEGSQFPIQDLS